MRLIIGITGASGVVMGCQLLTELQAFPHVETHLVMTAGAQETLRYETDLSLADVTRLATCTYDNLNLAARIASGSFHTDGMVVVPCSMKTAAGIVHGFAENLLLRAADVSLKEGRKVVLVPREMPLSRIHLRNLQAAADYGCVIIPPVLTFYNGADTVEKQVQHILGKVLMQFGLELPGFVPWEGRN